MVSTSHTTGGQGLLGKLKHLLGGGGGGLFVHIWM